MNYNFFNITDCIADLELVKDNCIGIGAFCTVFRGTYKSLLCAAKMLTHHAQFYASGMKAQPTVQELALKSLQKECEFLKKLSLLEHDQCGIH